MGTVWVTVDAHLLALGARLLVDDKNESARFDGGTFGSAGWKIECDTVPR